MQWGHGVSWQREYISHVHCDHGPSKYSGAQIRVPQLGEPIHLRDGILWFHENIESRHWIYECGAQIRVLKIPVFWILAGGTDYCG